MEKRKNNSRRNRLWHFRYEYCKKCWEEYLSDESMEIVENKLKEANLWNVERKEIKFWKTGKAITLRLPVELVSKLNLNKVKKGYIHREGSHKLTIENYKKQKPLKNHFSQILTWKSKS